MTPELDQLKGSNQTELEKNGEHFEFNAPVTEAVSIGDTIVFGFGDIYQCLGGRSFMGFGDIFHGLGAISQGLGAISQGLGGTTSQCFGENSQV